MITQQEEIVNEKIDNFKAHKLFAQKIQSTLSSLFKNKHNNQLTKKGLSIANCGTNLAFQHFFDEEDTRTLHSANFCKHKLCPMCAWRWHIKQSAILQRTFDILGQQDYYHLVLTIQNIKFMTHEFLVDLRRKAWEFMRKVAKSTDYFMSFEITVDERGWYHPHYHIIYINHLEKPLTRKTIQTEWAKISATGQKYAICKQSKCRGDRIALELTKYILKFDNIDPNETMLQVIDKSTWNCKKISTRGLIHSTKKQAEKELEKERFEKMQELQHFDSEIEFYKWLNGAYTRFEHPWSEN